MLWNNHRNEIILKIFRANTGASVNLNELAIVAVQERQPANRGENNVTEKINLTHIFITVLLF